MMKTEVLEGKKDDINVFVRVKYSVSVCVWVYGVCVCVLRCEKCGSEDLFFEVWLYQCVFSAHSNHSF